MSSNLTKLGAELLGITDNCPVAQCPSDDCPLCALARLPRAERRAWLAALSAAELQYLATYHYVCVWLKVADYEAHTPVSACAA